MKSTHQYRAKSTPKHVTLEGGIKIEAPMARSRTTPTDKTQAKPCCPPSYKAAK